VFGDIRDVVAAKAQHLVMGWRTPINLVLGLAHSLVLR